MVKEFLLNWLFVLIKPRSTFAKEKPKASMKKALINYAIFFGFLGVNLGFSHLYSSVVGFLVRFTNPQLSSNMFPIEMVLLRTDLFKSIETIVLFLIIGFFLIFLIQGVLFFIARRLKGKGNFVEQFYLTSLFIVPWGIIFIPLALLAMVTIALFIVPYLGYVLGPLIPLLIMIFIFLLVLLIYFFILVVLTLKEAHNFSFFRTILTLFGSIALFFIIVFLLIVIVAFLNRPDVNPTNNAVIILANSYNSEPPADDGSMIVEFYSGQKITNKEISDKSGLISPGELCMVKRESTKTQETDWEITNEYIMYKASGKKEANLIAYCDKEGKIEENIKQYDLFIKHFDLSDCHCLEKQICCVIGIQNELA